jgi:hypothetical protein
MGGLIEGPFGSPIVSTGTVNVAKVLTTGKGYRVTWKTGTKFTIGTAWEGLPIVINSNNFTVASVPVTATVLYVTSTPGAILTNVPYSISATSEHAVAPGVLSKKQ